MAGKTTNLQLQKIDNTDYAGNFPTIYNDNLDLIDGLKSDLITSVAGKQDKLIAGSGITIGSDGKTISSSGKEYIAGNGIQITDNKISIIYSRLNKYILEEILSDTAVFKAKYDYRAETIFLRYIETDTNNFINRAYSYFYPWLVYSTNPYNLGLSWSEYDDFTLYYYKLLKGNDYSKYIGNYTGTVEIQYAASATFTNNNLLRIMVDAQSVRIKVNNGISTEESEILTFKYNESNYIKVKIAIFAIRFLP